MSIIPHPLRNYKQLLELDCSRALSVFLVEDTTIENDKYFNSINVYNFTCTILSVLRERYFIYFGWSSWW